MHSQQSPTDLSTLVSSHFGPPAQVAMSDGGATSAAASVRAFDAAVPAETGDRYAAPAGVVRGSPKEPRKSMVLFFAGLPNLVSRKRRTVNRLDRLATRRRQKT